MILLTPVREYSIGFKLYGWGGIWCVLRGKTLPCMECHSSNGCHFAASLHWAQLSPQRCCSRTSHAGESLQPQRRDEMRWGLSASLNDLVGVGGLTSSAFFPRRWCERSRSCPVTSRCSSLLLESPPVGAALALNVYVYMSWYRTAKKYFTGSQISEQFPNWWFYPNPAKAYWQMWFFSLCRYERTAELQQKHSWWPGAH